MLEILKTGSDWLKIKVSNGYLNKAKPFFVSEKFLVKKKLNHASFMLKLGTKKKNFCTSTNDVCL